MQREPKKISPCELQNWINTCNRLPVLVDVREDSELQIASLPFDFIHLPLSKASDWMRNFRELLPEGRPIVVLCHAGVRSWSFGVWLLEQDCTNEVWNLEGGIDAWSISIDSNIPRY